MVSQHPDNVIRAEDAPVTPVAFQFEDIQALAKEFLRKQAAQAQRTIEAARKQAADIENAAHQEGQEKGYKEGYAKGEQEGHAAGEQAAREAFEGQTHSVAQALGTLLEALDGERLGLRNSAEVDLLGLALAIAERVVRRTIAIDPEVIRANVEAAIRLTIARRDLTMHVAPEDCAAVEAFLPELRSRFNTLERVELVADPDVERGGVRLVHNEGEIDLRIAEQFRALERALLGEADVSLGAVVGEQDLHANRQGDGPAHTPSGGVEPEEPGSAPTGEVDGTDDAGGAPSGPAV